MAEKLLEVKEVSKWFTAHGKKLHAVQRVSFDVFPNQTIGLVGESGSGKSTLGRVMLRLLEADQGKVLFQGKDLRQLSTKEMRKIRKDIQIIFQDPLASLNQRMTVSAAIEDAMVIQKIGTKVERKKKVDELLERVGLPSHIGYSYPFELSGGQQQRVGIARALSLNPKLIVCDEPISALDVSIQMQIIKLLKDLQQDFNLAYLFISHNLGVVRYLSHEVIVLYLGEVVEKATSEQLFRSPKHPYTKILMDAILKVPTSYENKKALTTIQGEMPSPFSPPSGCTFHPRCPLATEDCKHTKPALIDRGQGHFVSCNLID